MIVHKRTKIDRSSNQYPWYKMRDAWYLFGVILIYSREVNV